MKRFAVLGLTALMSFLLWAWLTPAQTDAKPLILPTPTATTPSLPACLTENGEGQALCYWDAQLSGDCAPDYVGGDEASTECITTHKQPSITRKNADGSTVTIPNGADLIAECLDIEREAKHDKGMREQLNKDGWNLTECFKAQRDW